MKNDKYPRFTVIIPQKDRAEFLIHTLRTCMIQDYPNFEVIVSDDCSEDSSVEIANDLAKQDSRIKVFAHKHHLGMRDNFEFALSQVQPGYVMALGGDDGLVVGGIQRMYEIINKTGCELLTWANANFTYGEQMGVSIRRIKNDGVRMIKSETFLNKIAKSFYYLIMDCPMLYIKGVASTELVNRVKARSEDNCFYHCPTPDGYSGIVLAGEVEEYAYTEEPLSINGATVKSQGANYMRADKKSREEAQQFFKDNIRRTMHAQLASQQYSPLLQLMTVDYLLTARDLPGWPGKFEDVDFKAMIQACFHSMANDFYDEEVLPREIDIIRQIAIQHGLEDEFNSLLSKTKRKVKKRQFNGYPFITPNVIVYDAKSLGLNNIYDASLAIPTLYKLLHTSSFTGLNGWYRMIKNTIKIFFINKDCIKVPLPQA
jgi:glycosyltransferase involved in cell wall biosynthesis